MGEWHRWGICKSDFEIHTRQYCVGGHIHKGSLCCQVSDWWICAKVYRIHRILTNKDKKQYPILFRLSWISSIGGILGLCIGGSFISVIEIAWFLISEISKKFTDKIKCQN